MELADCHVVITGASGALGGAVVEALVARGAIVHAPMVEATPPPSAVWLQHPKVLTKPAVDLADEDAVARYFAMLPSLWASVHLVGGFTMAPIASTRAADFDRMMTLNARTCFLACREAVVAIRRTGGGGRIVNVGARPVQQPAPNLVAYAASKAAVAAITQSLAVEVADEGILVNAILPSIIDTPANRASMPKADFASWPKPRELAETIAHLISPANAVTSGALLPVYGRA
ncbi:MAG TPA: SDR family NAD(P)-dependent oxidoreductase [Kofleriaceae bacterium]|nr:SDR family NAD(P)-dependent oxidoreductase [Kofleriaceae bacterium]